MLAIALLPHISSDRIQYDHSFIGKHEEFTGEPHPEFVFLRDDKRRFTFVVYFPCNQLVSHRKRFS